MTADDRLAIADLVARFDDAVNRQDVAQFAALWAEDAVWEIDDPVRLRVQGRDAIASTWAGQLNKVVWLFRGSFAGTVEVDGARASGRWPCLETGAWVNGRGYDNRSYYDDQYAFIDGCWVFARRRYIYLWLSEATVGGAPIPHTTGSSQ